MAFSLCVFVEKRLGEYWRVATDRLRAQILRSRGARLGRFARLGPGCRVKRPWSLCVGSRTEIEQDVFFKITDSDASLVIGERVFVGRGVEFDVSQRVRVGNDVLIAPCCFITDHTHRRSTETTISAQGCDAFDVTIEDDVWLGAGCVVLAGVTIGKGAVVGANSVVTRNVEAMTVVAGSPARLISRRI